MSEKSEFTSDPDVDREYNLSFYLPGAENELADWASRNAAFRSDHPEIFTARYGASEDEQLLVVQAEGNVPAPIHVFFHGGFWVRLAGADFAFVAESALASGISTVSVNYGLCPGTSLGEIVRQCRDAVAWIVRNAVSWRGDSARIIVSGHSAGGHIVAMLLATDWSDCGLEGNPIQTALAVSPLTDLEPLSRSWLQPLLNIDAHSIATLSPIRMLPSKPIPLIVAVGEQESDGFHEQSLRYVARVPWAQYVEVPQTHHLNVLDALARPAGILWRRLLQVAGLP